MPYMTLQQAFDFEAEFTPANDMAAMKMEEARTVPSAATDRIEGLLSHMGGDAFMNLYDNSERQFLAGCSLSAGERANRAAVMDQCTLFATQYVPNIPLARRAQAQNIAYCLLILGHIAREPEYECSLKM